MAYARIKQQHVLIGDLMAMKAWDKLNLEQKLRRIETAWRMQSEGRPPTEYAPYMSPNMLKAQFNNSIEEPPPGALPQSLFDASEAVRRGYTPPTGPDPPGPWSELPPQMQEGYGGAPTPRPMPGGPVGQFGPNPTDPGFQDYMRGLGFSSKEIMRISGTSPMGTTQFPTPDPINMMPQGQRIADLAVGLGNRLPQDLTNQIINQFAGSTAPVPGQTAPDIGVPNIPSMMAVPQPQPSVSGPTGDLGLGRMPQGIAPPMEISASPSGHRRSLTPGIEYGRMTTDSGRLVRDLGLGRTPQDIAPPMNMSAVGRGTHFSQWIPDWLRKKLGVR